MSKTLSIREFNENITKWLNNGKQLIITKNGKPLVKVIPIKGNVATQNAKEDVATPNKVATRTKPKKVATPISNPMDFCPKHPGSRKITCGCK